MNIEHFESLKINNWIGVIFNLHQIEIRKKVVHISKVKFWDSKMETVSSIWWCESDIRNLDVLWDVISCNARNSLIYKNEITGRIKMAIIWSDLIDRQIILPCIVDKRLAFDRWLIIYNRYVLKYYISHEPFT